MYNYRFPSPCGVWVVSVVNNLVYNIYTGFPSPCGVWVVSANLYKSRNGVDFAIVLYV